MMRLYWQILCALCAWRQGELLVIGVILLCWLTIGSLVSGVCRSWYPFGVSFVCVWIATASLALLLVANQGG